MFSLEILHPGIWKYAKWLLWSCFCLFAFFFLNSELQSHKLSTNLNQVGLLSIVTLLEEQGRHTVPLFPLSGAHCFLWPADTLSDRSVRMSSTMGLQICSDVRSLLVFLLLCFAFVATVEGNSWAILALLKCVVLTIESARSVNAYFWIPGDLIDFFFVSRIQILHIFF